MRQKEAYKNLSDSQLIELLRESDSLAFSEIFDRYKTFLFSFTYRRLGDIEQSKDIINDIFADLWEKRLRINIPGALEAFLVVVAKNRVTDLYRQKLVSEKHLDILRNRLNSYESTQTDHLVRHRNLAALIEVEIKALPVKMRIVFELSRKDAMTRKQISEYLGLPENTVRTNLSRALKILRGKLG